MRFQSSESDDEIVNRFRTTADSEIFSLLVDRYDRKVFAKCLGFFSNEQLAQDAVQDTFLQAFQKIDSYQSGNFQAWLLRVATNVCIDIWRRGKAFAEVELDDMAASTTFQDSYESLDFLNKLHREIKALPQGQRQCISLKAEGYSYEETAGRLGLSVKAVKSHIQNGRRMLSKRIREFQSDARLVRG